MESPVYVRPKNDLYQGSCRWLFAFGLVLSVGVSGFAQFLPPLHQPGTVRSSTWHLGQNLLGEEEAETILPGLVGNMSVIGDLDGNGVPDLVFGVPGISSFGYESLEDSVDAKGSIHVLLMHSKDSVLARVRIGDGNGGFTATLDSMDLFGAMVSGIGDVNGDDIPDLAVLAPGDDDGDEDMGAIYILFMDSDGTVDSHQKISATDGGFTGDLENGDRFTSLGKVGDLNGDGIPDLAVGAADAIFGSGNGPGAVWVLLLDTDGTVKDHWLLSTDTTWPSYDPTDAEDSNFGHSCVGMGDINGDGFNDIAVSSFRFTSDTTIIGAVHILLMDTVGTVLGTSRIAPGEGGLSNAIGKGTYFAMAISSLPDLNQDGIQELVVSAPFYGMHPELTEESFLFGSNFGVVAVLFLTDSGTVAEEVYVQDRQFHGVPAMSLLGLQVAAGEDFNNDSIPDLCAVSLLVAPGLSEPIWSLQIFHLEEYPFPEFTGICDPDTISVLKDSYVLGDPGVEWQGFGEGHRIAGLGDLDHNGFPDIAFGNPLNEDGGQITLLMPNLIDGMSTTVIGKDLGGFTVDLAEGDAFGASVAAIGDVDGDGVVDLAVLASGDDDGGSDLGAVYILFMNIDGTVREEQKISSTSGDFGGNLGNGNNFTSVASVGDIDSDGVPDLAVSAYKSNTGGTNRGAVWILFLNEDGTVKDSEHLSANSIWPGSNPAGTNGAGFGWKVVGLGDLSGNGNTSIAVTSTYEGLFQSLVYIIELAESGEIESTRTISPASLSSPIMPYFGFGYSLANVGDLNGDGVNDLGISAPVNYVDTAMRGAVVIVFLNPDGTVLCDQIITHGTAMQSGELEIAANSGFGFDMAGINDFNFDGINDLIVLSSSGIYFLALDGVSAPQTICSVGPNNEPSLKGLSTLDGSNTSDLPWNDAEFGFGAFLAPAGDVNGDGISDMAVGHPLDRKTPHGSVYLLMLDAEQIVETSVVIAPGLAGFAPTLDTLARFGIDVTAIGDLDGDGIQELAVLCMDSENSTSPTSILVLFLDDSGTVRDHQLISATEGGFTGDLSDNNHFLSLGKVGDMNGDGIPDLGVGAMLANNGESNQGAFWILLLEQDGSVLDHWYHSSESVWPGKSPIHGENILFGTSITGLGDVNGDGYSDIAISAPNQMGGTVHVIFLDDEGSIVGNNVIRNGTGGLNSALFPSFMFGSSIAGIGDINGDGIGDLVAAAPVQYTDSVLAGAIVLIHLNADGSVLCDALIEHGTAIDSTTLVLDNLALFGLKVAALGDIDGDQVMDIAVGAPGLLVEDSLRGRIHLFLLNGEPMEEQGQACIIDRDTELVQGFAIHDVEAESVAGAGDVNGDSMPDIVIGFPSEDYDKGLIRLALLENPEDILSLIEIGGGQGGFTDTLEAGDQFGAYVAGLGDVDGDGIPDIAVLAPGDDDGGSDLGAVYILFLTNSGSVREHQKISTTVGGFGGDTENGNSFATLAAVGDIDGDGIPDLAIGSPVSELGGTGRGSVWVLLLDSVGTVKEHWQFSALSTWPAASPINVDEMGFGHAITGLGDLNGDGVGDLAITSIDSDGRGLVHILQPDLNGDVIAYAKLGKGLGGQKAPVPANPYFGASLAGVGDLNEDGVPDLAVGIPNYKSDSLSGGVLVLYLNEQGRIICDELITDTVNVHDGPLGLGEGAGFGYVVSSIDDKRGDASRLLAVGTTDGRIYLLSLGSQDFSVSITVQEETPDLLGQVSVSVHGGTGPYTIAWGEKFPTREAYATLQGELPPSVHDLVGTGSLDLSTLSYDSLALLSIPEDGMVPAGIYHIHVTDSNDVRISSVVHVGHELSLVDSTAAIYDGENKTLTVSTSEESTMVLFNNILPKNYIGWVNFSIPNADQFAAVALFYMDSDTSNLEDGLLSAILVSGSMTEMYIGDSAYEYYTSHQTSSNYLLYVDSAYAKIYVNNAMVAISELDSKFEHIHLIMVLGNNDRISNISSNFLNTVWNTATTLPLSPLTPGSGNIDLVLNDTYGPYHLEWGHGEITDGYVGDLSPGTYSSTIASDYFGTSKTFHHVVGHEILADIPEGYASEQTQGGIGVRKVAGDTLANWGPMVRSENMVDKGADHWVSFKPDLEGWQEHAAVLGLSADVDSAMWAGWRVHVLGGLMVAQAIGRSGVLARAVIRNRDELTIQLDSAMVTFLHNGKPVHWFERPIEGPSRLAGALYGEGARILDAHTSIPVPLIVNTGMLTHGSEFIVTTPEDLNSSAISGSQSSVELDPSLLRGPYILEAQATDSTDAVTILFDLQEGEPRNVRLLIDPDTLDVDGSLFEFHFPNHWVLYDEPEVHVEQTTPPFYLDLERHILMSPDNDENHDEFRIIGLGPNADLVLTITDRSQNLVFQTSDPGLGWNGRFMNTGSMVEQGTYVYVIDLDGETFSGQFMVKY